MKRSIMRFYLKPNYGFKKVKVEVKRHLKAKGKNFSKNVYFKSKSKYSKAQI